MTGDLEKGVPTLSLELLGRLEAAWTAQGAPCARIDTPGLTDEEMDEITGPIGLSLPMEARLWWGWHDGVPGREGEIQPARWIGPDREYRPLREAVENYLFDRKIFADIEGDPEPFRPAALFPITRSSGPILCDCSVPVGAPSPIYYTHAYGDPEDELQRPKARSFGELVTWWIEALDDGIWRWDRERGLWAYDPERLPLQRDGLV